MQAEAKTYLGPEAESDIDKILKDSIAPNVGNILQVLQTWDTKLQQSNLSQLLGVY